MLTVTECVATRSTKGNGRGKRKEKKTGREVTTTFMSEINREHRVHRVKIVIYKFIGARGPPDSRVHTHAFRDPRINDAFYFSKRFRMKAFLETFCLTFNEFRLSNLVSFFFPLFTWTRVVRKFVVTYHFVLKAKVTRRHVSCAEAKNTKDWIMVRTLRYVCKSKGALAGFMKPKYVRCSLSLLARETFKDCSFCCNENCSRHSSHTVAAFNESRRALVIGFVTLCARTL